MKTIPVKRKQLSIRLPEAMHDVLTMFCADRGISVSSLVATAIAAHIKYKPPVRKAATPRGTMTDEECRAFAIEASKEYVDPQYEELRRRAERAPVVADTDDDFGEFTEEEMADLLRRAQNAPVKPYP